MASRPPVRPIICRNCGDEIVIVAQYLPTGPLCADCAPPDHPTQIPQITPNEEHGRRATASPEDGHPKENAAQASADAGVDRAASCDPRAFRPAPRAQELAVEVEEWIYLESSFLLATPTDLYCEGALSGAPRYSRFMVVLEWSRDGGPTMRDIGVGFASGLTDRQAALAEATAFARAEAKRLQAVGPFGFKPAREIPEVRHETGTKPSVDESAHDPRPSTGPTAQAVEAPGTAGEAHGA